MSIFTLIVCVHCNYIHTSSINVQFVLYAAHSLSLVRNYQLPTASATSITFSFI